MMAFIFNLAVSATITATAVWLSQRYTNIAGFLVTMPLTSMTILVLTQLEHDDTAATLKLARSICIGLPLSLLFFVPFFVPQRFGWPFWLRYSLGVTAIALSYFIHRAMTRIA